MKNLFLFLTALVLSSQGYSQFTEKFIPSNSPILLSFKNSEIRSKIDEGLLNSLDIYQNLSKENKDFFTSYLKTLILNDETIGISSEGNSYVTFNINDTVTSIQFIIPMGDKSKLEATAKGYNRMTEVPSISSKFKVLKKAYGEEFISYNNEVIILSNVDVKYQFLEQKASQKFDYYSYYNSASSEEATLEVTEEVVEEPYSDAVYEDTPPQRDYEAENRYKDSLKNTIQTQYLENLFSTSSNLSGDILAFTQKSYDIGFYLDYTKVYDMYMENVLKSTEGMMSLGNIQSQYLKIFEQMNGLYKEAKIFGELSFDADEIKIKSSFTGDKSTIAAMQNVLDAKVNKNILKYIKSDSLVSVFSSAVNVEAYADFYEETFDRMINSLSKEDEKVEMMKDAFDILTTLLIDEDEIYDLLKGDMVLTFNGVRNFEYEYEYQDYYSDTSIIQTRTINKPIFSMMSSMGNKKVMDKVMNIIRKSEFFNEVGGYFVTKKVIEKEVGNLYLAYKNGILFFTNDESLMFNLNSGFPKSQQMSKTMKKNVLANNMYAFFDADKMITSLNGMFNGNEQAMANIFLERLGLLEIKGSKIENGALTSIMTMDVEGENNSLMNVFLMVHELYESSKK